MQLLELKSPAGRCYRLGDPVYETDTVWCGVTRDAEYGDCFVKIILYGRQMPEDQRQICAWAKSEAQTMERVAVCTKFTPRLYEHWDDREAGRYVLVMQKLPGITLEQWLEENPLNDPDGKTLFVRNLILYQVAEILLAVYDKIRLSHRDLKPQNIIVSREKNGHYRVYLIDFGTAGQNYTIGSGSDGYQAPEQLEQVPGTKDKTDIFALGMVWHQMLSGIPAQVTRWEFCRDGDAYAWEQRPSLPQWVLAQKKGPVYQRLFESMTEFDPEDRVACFRVCKTLEPRRK
jgi:serine/threonine protein kinase